jgi:hypothetical protein
MGGVVDIVSASTSAPLVVTISFAAAPTWAAMEGVYGSITHALWAKANLDIERTTPGSNSNDPAYTSVLSSIGVALEFQAGADVNGFAATVASVPQLLQEALSEVEKINSPRKSYSAMLLANADM